MTSEEKSSFSAEAIIVSVLHVHAYSWRYYHNKFMHQCWRVPAPNTHCSVVCASVCVCVCSCDAYGFSCTSRSQTSSSHSSRKSAELSRLCLYLWVLRTWSWEKEIQTTFHIKIGVWHFTENSFNAILGMLVCLHFNGYIFKAVSKNWSSIKMHYASNLWMNANKVALQCHRRTISG